MSTSSEHNSSGIEWRAMPAYSQSSDDEPVIYRDNLQYVNQWICDSDTALVCEPDKCEVFF